MTGTEFRARRLRLHMSQPQLAAAMQVSESLVASLERGNLPLERRQRLYDLALSGLEGEHGLKTWRSLSAAERAALTTTAAADIAGRRLTLTKKASKKR